MPDINQINGLVLCDEINVNGVTIANITNIDDITKSCVSCREIQLARSTESCSEACGLKCATYYTTAPGVPAAGDYIYQTEECNCDGEQPEVTYYSNKCGERSGNCFTVNSSCEVGPIAGCGR
tara:strand:- start:16 stop:384 length:369 start_codon:yes stop_codon:yes gene_type:complete